MKKPSSPPPPLAARQQQVRATLHDVAKRLGVSHVTVWRALRRSPKVSEARRQEIEGVAAEMGYRPNPAAATLVQFRRASKIKPIAAALAWLNFWPEPKRLRSNALFDAQWRGALEAAEALGYRVDEFTCNESLPPEKLKRVLNARGIHGVLLPPQRPIPREKYDFDWSGFAAVRLGHSVPYPKVHLVTFAQASNTLDALKKMQQLGYRRIGFVTAMTIRAYALFDAGYLKAQAAWQKKDRIPVLELADPPYNTPKELEKLSAWLKKYQPEAVLSTEGTICSLLNAARYRVPEDIGVAATSVSISDADAGMFEEPAEVGRAAVKSLVALIQWGEFGIPEFRQNILLRGNWRDGSSLPGRR